LKEGREGRRKGRKEKTGKKKRMGRVFGGGSEIKIKMKLK